MNLSIFIARRYLFSKKKQNAINIISIISMVGVAIGTTALIVVLSVFNGIDTLLTEATDTFTPDLTISPAKGKFIETDSSLLEKLAKIPGIASYDPVVEENSLVKFKDKLVPVVVKGVDSTYADHVNIRQSVISGIYTLEEEGKPTVVMGYGIAAALKIRMGLSSPVTFYYPDRKASSASSSALNNLQIYPLGIFSAQQDIDGKYVITGIETARELFGVPGQISKIEIKLQNPDQAISLKEELSPQLKPIYKVEDKYDLNRSFYAMMKSEKLAVFLILLFILLIASFNIIGSVSMLIIDKKEDIGIYRALGMTKEKIISIFKLEGNLITGFGALIGLILGTLLCLLQEYYGFITLGNGSYIVSAYPVKVITSDVLIIMITVISFWGFKAISVVSEPMSFTSSSFTIFITICPGVRLVRTSCPTARSCTELMNCFTTLKLTSASRSAIFTSFSAVFTSASVKRPLPLKFLKTFCNLSAKLSNAMKTLPLAYSFPISSEIASILSIRDRSPSFLYWPASSLISSTIFFVWLNFSTSFSFSSYPERILSQRFTRSCTPCLLIPCSSAISLRDMSLNTTSSYTRRWCSVKSSP